jgi:hypothetical protein
MNNTHRNGVFMIDPDAIAAAVAAVKQKQEASHSATAAGKGAVEGATSPDTGAPSKTNAESEKDTGKNPKKTMEPDKDRAKNAPKQEGYGNVEPSVPSNAEPMRSATNPTPEKQSGGRDAGAGPGDLGSLPTPTFGASSPNSGSNRGR